MPCFHPVPAWRTSKVIDVKSGRPRIFFKEKFVKPYPSDTIEVLSLPCGKCDGCRLSRSRAWAARCMHEASQHDDNCFITLTYDDKFLPLNSSLDKSDYVKFLKRLRGFVAESASVPAPAVSNRTSAGKPAAPASFGRRVSFFLCGEYGLNFGRPHYHILLFGFDFPDRVLYDVRCGFKLYTSELLGKLWADPDTHESYGFSTVGDLTFESAAYVARYCLKKVVGHEADAHYGDREPEFTRMSLRPAIGRKWISSFMESVYPDDFLIANGMRIKPPRYYDSLFEISRPELMAEIKSARVQRAKLSPDNTPSRLAARERVTKAKLKLLTRRLT